MKKRTCLSLAGLWFVSSLVLTPVAADEAVDPTTWAPKDALFFVGAANCQQVAESFKKTSSYRAATDPQLEDVFAEMLEFLEQGLQNVVEELGLDGLDELKVYPQGAAAFYITLAPPTDDEDEPQFGFVLALDMGENIEKTRNLLAKITSKTLEEGARKETEEILSVKVVTLHLPESKEDQPPAEDDFEGAMEQVPAFDDGPVFEEIAYGIDGSRVIVGTSTKDVAQAVRCVKGRTKKTLAKSKAAKLLARKCPKDASIRMLFDLPAVFEMVRITEPDSKEDLRAWGTDGLGPIVGGMALAPEAGVDVRMYGFWKLDDQASGVPAMLRMKNRPVAPSATVAASAAVYGFMNVDPNALVKEIIDTVSRTDPESGAEMRAGMKMPLPDGTVFDVQGEFLNHLAGPLSAQLTLAKPYAAEDIGLQLAVGHSDRQAMEKLFALPMLAPMLQKRELLGSTLFEPMMLPVGGVSLLVTDAVVSAGTTGQLERHVRAEGKSGPSLADDETFKQLLRRSPKEACMAFYVDSGRVYDAQMAIHRSGDAAAGPQFQFGMSLNELLRAGLAHLFTGAEVEKPEALRAYQGAAMFTVTTESDGLRFEAVQEVRPPAK